MLRQIKAVVRPALTKLAGRANLYLLPKHFYTPIADQDELSRTRSTWAKRTPMHGIHWSSPEQLSTLRQMVARFEPEYGGNPKFKQGTASGYGPGFGYIEAECLHGFLRHHKPRRIIEIGSGVSTYCALHAADMNAREGSPATITCVEPYPSDFIRTVKGIDLVERRAEQLDPAFFDQLEAGDFLFIDSTHAVKPKGDVEFIYLELIPRLKPGVLIHIHDIHLPFTHQRDLLTTRFQWAETILLTALLTGNQNLSVLFCLSLLHYDEPEGLREVFPEYRREPGEDGLDVRERELHYPSSIYLETR